MVELSTRHCHPDYFYYQIDGTLTILTPFDPLFLLISLLSLLPAHYLSYEDLWESLSTKGIPGPGASTDDAVEEEAEKDETMAEDIGKLGELPCVRKRLSSICETLGEHLFYSTLFYSDKRTN